MINKAILAVIEKDEDGYFGSCRELPGCHTQGDTIEELMVNLREAAELYIETLSPSERERLGNGEVVTASLEVSLG